ncbi:MAG: SUMF1/EgtB/PvdO family nonheme iron enzyme [Anaerolineae bacterium]|nr:SUMF1/EgtB/PvdO family nonheme iron enzyme [Anaerolineae bacterium]
MRLFISYSRDDKAWTYELWRALRDRADHDAWIDQRIIPAQDWWDSILAHIEWAECIVYVITPKAAESIYCLAELHYALALNKPVVPLMLKPCDYPHELRKRHIQYRMIDDDMTLDYVLLMVERALGEIRVCLLQGKYAPPDPLPPRPDEPRPARKTGQVSETYMLAEEAASENNVTLAEKLFQDVIDADPKGNYGVAAAERLEEIRYERDRDADYGIIVQMIGNPAQRKGAVALWRSFVKTYGADHDPANVADICAEWEKQEKQKRPRVAQAQPEPPPEKPKPVRKPRQKKSPPATAAPPKPRVLRVPDLLPPPFAWIEIPAGRVEIEDGHGAFDVPAFMIAKYLLTNAQFAKFIEAGGYREKKWWTAAGWQQREQAGWTKPCFWNDEKWNGADYPVVGVSWYEAVAFCRWLSEMSGEPVMLPTEQQWQRAAQGDDGRTYPWGNEWDGSRCNNSVKPYDSNQTTPVRQYEGKGDSLFGVVDMAGNVWEWCLTDYEKGTNDVNRNAKYRDRVLRGGSWYNHPDNFRVSYRICREPYFRDSSLGFRCTCSK